MLYYFIVLCYCGCVLSELLNKFEGAPCIWEERTGKCANIFQCKSSIQHLKTKNYPPICSFKGKEPIICCTDCELVDDIRNLIYIPNVGDIVKTGRTKSDEKCYEYLQTLEYPCKKTIKTEQETTVDENRNCNNLNVRVTQLNDTDGETLKNRFPHMAYLGYGEKVDNADWLCAGSVISERFILTSAECLEPDRTVGKVRFIALGLHKRWVSPNQWEIYTVKRTFSHPEYKPSSKYHDIALIETDKAITFGPNVFPACLDSGNTSSDVEFTTIVWSEGDNSTLDSVQLSNFDELECSIFYPSQKTLKVGYNHTIQMCLGQRSKPKDTCETEIGAPLQYSLKSCVYMISGIVSRKRVCGESGGSGLFTRVSYYLPWIESIVWL